MRRSATAGELDAMSEEERACYEEGRPFSYAGIGQVYRLRPFKGALPTGAYVVQKPLAALKDALAAIRQEAKSE